MEDITILLFVLVKVKGHLDGYDGDINWNIIVPSKRRNTANFLLRLPVRNREKKYDVEFSFYGYCKHVLKFRNGYVYDKWVIAEHRINPNVKDIILQRAPISVTIDGTI